ncbi:MAG: putative thermolysin family peptidase, partial [Ilumatobacteraceae bacterium]|nr:putative thermolysin family peptidase [Ilumatobacteraceae bacterium]
MAVVLCLTAGVSGMSMVDVSSASARPTTTPHTARDDGDGKSNAALQAQLQATSGGQATIAFNDTTGDATYLGGSEAHPLQAKGGDGQEALARRFVDTYAPLFGIADASKDLQQTQSFNGDAGTGGAVRYQQTINGVPVIAGVIAVQVASDGAVLSATGEATGGRGIDTTPTVAAQDAAQSAVSLTARAAGADASVLDAGAPTLSVYDASLLDIDDPLGTRLVWQFAVTSAGGDVNRFVLIDAHDATVALQFDQVEAALNRTVCDDHNDNTLSETCTTPVRSEGQPPVVDGPTVSAANVNLAYDLSGVTYNFYHDRFGRDSLDNAGLPLASTVRYCDPNELCPYANAYWNDHQMVYGDGYATADDVVGHELTHGVTSFTSNLIYLGQSGAINESMSDVMGEFIDLTNTVSGPDLPGDRWKLAEQLPIGAIRNMANPPLFGDPDKMSSPNYYLGAADSGGVHRNSGVSNKADTLITDGGSFNGQVITGLGIDKAAKIYYQLETTLLTQGSNYSDVFRQLPQACTNLIGVIGITATDCQQVVKTVIATEMNRKPGGDGSPATVCTSGVRDAIAFSDDMESDGGNWLRSTTGNGAAWDYSTAVSTSGSRSMHVLDRNGPLGTSTLAMASSATVPAGSSYFSFEHSIKSDANSASVVYDGGIVQYSVDAGATWIDIAGAAGSAGPPAVPAVPALPTVHGYTVTLSNSGAGSPPLKNDLHGRPAFGGIDAGFVTTTVDTSSLAGQSVRFRYVFGIDNFLAVGGTTFPGWYIDDVSLYGCGNVNVPGAVRLPSAVAGDASATVSWQAPAFDGGGAITSYVITPFLSGIAQTPVNTGSAAVSFVVPGLTRGGSYTFIVAAVNSAGTGPASPETTPVVTPAVAPRAPTNVTAAAADRSAIVSWTAPVDNGGSAIIGYVVTPFLGATALPSSSAGDATSLVVNGLTNGQAYTFTVAAVNAIGTGAASAASVPVTPTAAIPLLPGRVLDTRIGGITVDGRSAGIGIRSAGSVTELTVAGR